MTSPRTATLWRGVKLLFAASAAAELVVGIAAAVAPAAVTALLLGEAVEGVGAVAARMAGIAVAALGLGWWLDRNRLDLPRLRQVAGAYVVYNLGIAALFIVYAATADRTLPVSWLIGLLHLLAAGAFVAGLALVHSGGSTG